MVSPQCVFLMNYQITMPGKTFTACNALIWFLPSLYFLMGYPITSSKTLVILLHILHSWYSFPPVCIFSWYIKLLLWKKKPFSHVLYWCGFSSVYIFMWIIIWHLCVKLLPHVLHWYSFSPVCILSCLIQSLLWLKFLLHILHWCGFSPVCIFSRFIK